MSRVRNPSTDVALLAAVVIAGVIFAMLLGGCNFFTSPMVYTNDVPNLVQVDANIWRSGQITTRTGWETVHRLASNRHVVILKLNFENEGGDAIGQSMGFEVVNVAIQPEGDQDLLDDLKSAFRQPDPAVVYAAELRLAHCLANPTTEICLVHCTHGQDRTGFVVGEHRVKNEGWPKTAAYNEMRQNNFHLALRGVNEAWEAFQP